MCTVVELTHEQEQERCNDAVAHHDKHRGRKTALGTGGDAEQDKAHVRDARERDEALEVRLRKSERGSVDDPHTAEDPEDRSSRIERLRRDRDREAQQSIPAHLKQHASQ